MNGYSKIRLVGSTKSRSIDFSDLFSPPQTPKPITYPDLIKPSSQTQETAKQAFDNTDDIAGKEHEEGVGESFGVILSRNCSTSAVSSKMFKLEKQNTGVLQSAVRRAFSMRKSSSVSEGYCRIYDQCDPTISSPTDDDLNMHIRSNKKKKRGKILTACKRLFGFH